MRAGQLGTTAGGPAGVRGAQGESVDPLLGADDQVRPLVEVRDPVQCLLRILVRDTERLADVRWVDHRLADHGLHRAGWVVSLRWLRKFARPSPGLAVASAATPFAVMLLTRNAAAAIETRN